MSPGLQISVSGSGVFGSTDFLTPGTAFEGFYLTHSIGSAGANNDGSAGSFGISMPTLLSATSASWNGSGNGFEVTNVYTLVSANSRPEISIRTTLKNISGTAMSGVKFLRTLDPDPDAYTYGIYSTLNSIPNSSTATARGPSSGLGISIFTNDSTFTHRAGVSSSWSTDPAAYLLGLNAGTYGDYSIGLAFDIGTLANGSSVSFEYGYYGSIAAVPEPSTYAMALAGLACAAWGGFRKRSRIRSDRSPTNAA